MIEKEILANPEISNEDLRAKAEKLDDAVARMSARQFNATYPLQVKRRMRPRRRSGRKAPGSKRGGRGTKAASRNGRGRPSSTAGTVRASGDARARVRGVLVAFASDLASANGAELVRVIAGVDTYVDRVLKATGGRA